MNSILEETIEYRHKKFDQSKRLRSNSLSSSGRDYGSIKLETEKNDDSPYHPTTFECSSAYNWCKKEISIKRPLSSTNEEDSFIPLASKRARLNSFSTSKRHQTSTPLTTAAATTVPPAAAILPKISDETLRSICKYHGNMVRKFPKKERTPKDQERRNKNTIACRMSRRVKKLEYIAIEEQYKEFSQQTFDIIEQCMRATAYLQELVKYTNCSQTRIEQTQNSKSWPANTSVAVPQKKPFTIAFLTGKE